MEEWTTIRIKKKFVEDMKKVVPKGTTYGDYLEEMFNSHIKAKE